MSARNGMRPVHPGEVLRDEIEVLDLRKRKLRLFEWHSEWHKL